MNNTIARVTNTATMETTTYSNFTFDEVIKFNGRHYGVKNDGIYLLEGENDGGSEITGSFLTNKNHLGTQLLKKGAYIFIDSDNPTELTAIADDISSPAYQAEYAGKRTKIGRGIVGRYWAFTMKNLTGSRMRIRGMDAELEVMTRKIS